MFRLLMERFAPDVAISADFEGTSDGVLTWHAIAVIIIVFLGTVFNILAFRVMSCPSMTFLNAYFYLKGQNRMQD